MSLIWWRNESSVKGSGKRLVNKHERGHRAGTSDKERKATVPSFKKLTFDFRSHFSIVIVSIITGHLWVFTVPFQY